MTYTYVQRTVCAFFKKINKTVPVQWRTRMGQTLKLSVFKPFGAKKWCRSKLQSLCRNLSFMSPETFLLASAHLCTCVKAHRLHQVLSKCKCRYLIVVTLLSISKQAVKRSDTANKSEPSIETCCVNAVLDPMRWVRTHHADTDMHPAGLICRFADVRMWGGCAICPDQGVQHTSLESC